MCSRNFCPPSKPETALTLTCISFFREVLCAHEYVIVIIIFIVVMILERNIYRIWNHP